MTYTEFLDRLAQTPRDWWITTNGQIRRCLPTQCQCPISACRDMPAAAWSTAADLLELDEEVAANIANTADLLEFSDMQVRSDLLRACGLQEQE